MGLSLNLRIFSLLFSGLSAKIEDPGETKLYPYKIPSIMICLVIYKPVKMHEGILKYCVHKAKKS